MTGTAAPRSMQLSDAVHSEFDALRTVLAADDAVSRFHPDPIPEPLLRQLLGAGHRAPSFRDAQPWRFVVVGCDLGVTRVGEPGGDSFPEADMWSCVCAIRNIALAARAAGIGASWVTLIAPADLAALVRLPAGVEPLGWLSLGWPAARSPGSGAEVDPWPNRLHLDEIGARDLLGVLDCAVDRLCAAGVNASHGGTVVMVGAGEPVPTMTVALARAAEAQVVTYEPAARGRQGDLIVSDARRPADLSRLLAEGQDAGRRAAAAGLVCLGNAWSGNAVVTDSVDGNVSSATLERRRETVLLDGLATALAALVAATCEPTVRPLFDLGPRPSAGVAACLAAQLLRSAVIARRDSVPAR